MQVIFTNGWVVTGIGSGIRLVTDSVPFTIITNNVLNRQFALIPGKVVVYVRYRLARAIQPDIHLGNLALA